MAGTTHDLTLGFAYTPASQIVLNTRSNDLYRYNGQTVGSTASTVNGLNQVTTSGGATLAHDARGNMTSDGTKTYGYDLENMLISATGATLAYDPALRLYQVTGVATTRFIYDGPDVIAETNGSNVVQRRYVHGPGADEPLVWYEGTGTSDRRFLHTDERGSVVAVSNSSGVVTNVNTYDEYGRPGASNVGRFQYTGQKWIAEIGLYDYKARMYHPTLGRFMQTDPIGYEDGMNLYAYAGNDPVNLVDPSGHFFEPLNHHVLWRDPLELPGGTVTGHRDTGLSTTVMIALYDAFLPRGAPPAQQGGPNPSSGQRRPNREDREEQERERRRIREQCRQFIIGSLYASAPMIGAIVAGREAAKFVRPATGGLVTSSRAVGIGVGITMGISIAVSISILGEYTDALVEQTCGRE